MKFCFFVLLTFVLQLNGENIYEDKADEGHLLGCTGIKTHPNQLKESVSRLWTSRRINFSYGNVNSNVRSNINKALSILRSTFPQLTFTQRASGDYLAFQADGSGCWSYIGRVGGRQAVNVDAACGCSSTVHEILHALGLSHEQNRLDRNRHIHVRNINPQSSSDRQLCNNNVIRTGSSHNTVAAYDTESIMHYGEFVRWCNPRQQVLFNQPHQPRIRRNVNNGKCGLSRLDIQKINNLYRR